MVKIKYCHETKNIIELPKGTTDGMYIDGYLWKNLQKAKRIIKEDWDMIFLYDGYEGSGKSVKAQQDAFTCAPKTFNIDQICFTPGEFRKCVLRSKPYEAVVYDEAYTGLSSRGTMGVINKALVSMLAEIRQKNLFVFIVMPTFFDLDRYCALWRSRALIHVYTENYKRGYFQFYNADRKKSLYLIGKKLYDYRKPIPNFRGRFTNTYTVNEKEYRKRKAEALNARENKRIEQEQQRELENLLFERVMNMDANINDKVPHKLKMEILGLPQSTYFYKLKQYNEIKQIS